MLPQWYLIEESLFHSAKIKWKDKYFQKDKVRKMKKINFCKQTKCEEARPQQERHESKPCWLDISVVKVLEQIDIKIYEIQNIKRKRL